MINNKSKKEVLQQYLDYKKTTNNTDKNIKRYEYFTSMFINSTKKTLKEFREEDINNFLNKISNKYSIGTMNEIKIMIKSFLIWYYDDYSKRFRNIKKICCSIRKERTYSPEQMLQKEDIEKLVQEEEEIYWKTYLLLLFYGGFRPKEVCDLEWKNIIFDKEGCYIKVFVKKNGKEFEKFIPEHVCFYLKKLQNNNSRYVFPTKRKQWNVTKKNQKIIQRGDTPMTRSGVYQHLIPLAKRVLNKHINPYILRHSIATILYNRDDLKDDDVAQQMGHSKAMKQIYNNLSIDKIRERMKKIYIKPEDLPPEKKAEYEEMIKQLQEDNDKKFEFIFHVLGLEDNFNRNIEIAWEKWGKTEGNSFKEKLINFNK